MQNTKILEMLNSGQIEELKVLIQEEIFTDELKSKPGAKQRYTAMKKYFSYIKNSNPFYTMPCVIDFCGEKYTSFSNGYSIALTKESSGEMKLFEDSEKYLNISKMITYDGEVKKIDFKQIMAEAKSKGYRLKNSEVDQNRDFKFMLHFNNAYFKIGLLDITYSIINDGEIVTVYSKGEKHSPLILKNDIGICLVLPFNYNAGKEGVTTIEVV